MSPIAIPGVMAASGPVVIRAGRSRARGSRGTRARGGDEHRGGHRRRGVDGRSRARGLVEAMLRKTNGKITRGCWFARLAPVSRARGFRTSPSRSQKNVPTLASETAYVVNVAPVSPSPSSSSQRRTTYAVSSAATSTCAWVVTRLRSPYTLSMREVLGQNLDCLTHSDGNAAVSLLYGLSHLSDMTTAAV